MLKEKISIRIFEKLPFLPKKTFLLTEISPNIDDICTRIVDICVSLG